MPISLAILASGRGSNLNSILNAIDRGELEAEVSAVVSNNPEAGALSIARDHGLPTVIIDHRRIGREEHERQMLRELSKFRTDYLILAGYMRLLTPQFLKHFRHPLGFYRIVNIHPSLLPAFPGATAYEDAFAYGVRLSGVTVHLVDEQVDHGPILAQEGFPRLQQDTLEDFMARGLELEHRLYPQVLQKVAKQGIELLPSGTQGSNHTIENKRRSSEGIKP